MNDFQQAGMMAGQKWLNGLGVTPKEGIGVKEPDLARSPRSWPEDFKKNYLEQFWGQANVIDKGTDSQRFEIYSPIFPHYDPKNGFGISRGGVIDPPITEKDVEIIDGVPIIRLNGVKNDIQKRGRQIDKSRNGPPQGGKSDK